MAAFSTPQGYRCEFIESVPAEDFHCKLCSLVARALTITSCCGESYCRTCIDAVQQDGHPCPGCGEESFKVFPQVKYQQRIAKFQVYCTMKEKGCGWTGALEHLETHLDPDQGDCQYVDVNCPLKCDKKIEKRNIDQHTANKCVKRDHVCPYCSFKATYEMIRDTHWPECKYYPLMCPNRCGVTCEQAEMEDHMNICRLEEVECEFSYAGCKERFRREEWEEHAKENSMKHLSMVATAAVKDRQEFQTKIEEQEKKLKEQEKKSEMELRTKLAEQEKESKKRAGEHEEKLEEQLKERKEKLEEQRKMFEEKLQEQKEVLVREIVQLKVKCHKQSETIQTLKTFSCFKEHKFTVENFSEKKRMDAVWYTPLMYTHVCGYKFRIDVYANGVHSALGNSVTVGVRSWIGEFDDQLKWPFKGVFTIQLINHFPGGVNKEIVEAQTWPKPQVGVHYYSSFAGQKFVAHSEYNSDRNKTYYLKDDNLQFRITDITLTN